MSTQNPQRRHEEQRLFRAYRSGDPRAREQLVERYLPLARSLARRYARNSEPLEDLEQVASLALVKAIDRFQPDRGTAFSSFAVPSIAGAIKRHYRDLGWTVRPPRDMQDLAINVVNAIEQLRSTSSAEPTAAQIAEHLGTTVEAVLDAREAYRALHCESLDAPVGTSEEGQRDTLLDTLGVSDTDLACTFDRVALDALLHQLDERDRLIIKLYYKDELTQDEIGRRIGYSQMHVSRIIRKAVSRLTELAAAANTVPERASTPALRPRPKRPPDARPPHASVTNGSLDLYEQLVLSDSSQAR
jgi:RNA polymerase sigma-B factor